MIIIILVMEGKIDYLNNFIIDLNNNDYKVIIFW